MVSRTLLLATALALTAVAQSPKGAAPISMAGLAAEIGDPTSAAYEPAVAFTLRQFSSYDRRSTDPKVATDEGWFANGDQGRFLRVEERGGRREYVMAEAEGPGAVVRLWSADPKGVLRAYVDGGEAPALEVDAADFLGGRTPLAPPPVAGVRGRGWNSFLPIPFARRLKLTLSEERVYYHVGVRSYPAGTSVRSYSAEEAAAAAPAVAEAAARLRASETTKYPSLESAGAMHVFSTELAPGEAKSVDVSNGGKPGVVTWNAVFFGVPPADRAAALRGVVVRWTFDGEPCVEAPLGDLFAAGPGDEAFGSAATGRTKDGVLYSRWPMPFERAATVEYKNFGAQPVALVTQLAIEDPPAGRKALRFHAGWTQELDRRTLPRRDWRVLEATGGAGVFVGCSLGFVNPVRGWWGEGDERFYVDGEAFPSTFGTGTEDFFGYAWCDPTPFVHALHGQPRCDGPGNYGFTTLYRWMLSDRVPFTKSFAFDLEVWHWVDCVASQAMTVFWYGAPGARDGRPPLRPEDLRLPTLPPLKVKRVAGALEGEALKAKADGGAVLPQDLAGFGDERWSGDAQLWWRDAAPGARLEAAFPIAAAGRYRVFAAFTRAPDYGIHRLAVDGVDVGEDRDFYGPDVAPTGEIDLGVFEFSAGDHLLGVRCVGANPAARPGRMFGLDYLRAVLVE